MAAAGAAATPAAQEGLGLTPPLLFGGAGAWALAMTASMLAYEWRLNALNSVHLPLMSLIFSAGGAIGWLTAVPIARWLTLRRPVENRFSAYLLGLMLATVSFTAFLFSMQYRIFYSQWHDPIGTVGWTFEFLETGLGAVYQFMVLGLPHFLPIGFPALLLASGWLAKSLR